MGKYKKFTLFYSKSSIIAFFVLFGLASLLFLEYNFASSANVMTLIRKAATDGGLLAIGMSFVLITGNIDLSLGSVMCMGGMIIGFIGNDNPLLAILVALAFGVVSGLANGFLVTKLNLSVWIATLCMQMFVKGLAYVTSNSESINIDNEFLLQFGSGDLFGLIPYTVVVFFVCLAVWMFVLRNTRLGLAIYAVGGNEEAAHMMGLRVNWVKTAVFMIAGFMAALGGVVSTCRIASAQPLSGETWNTYALAMSALGGIRVGGGAGKVSGTFFGILIYCTLTTVFNYVPNISAWWQNVLMGILVLLSAGLQSAELKSFFNEALKKIKK